MQFPTKHNDHAYIFTGGPGSGKSTVLNLLASQGYWTVPEVARDIIRRQMATSGDALPWGDTVRYAHLMFLRSLADYEEYAHVSAPCFFDRGMIDTLGYCRLLRQPVPEEWNALARACRYHPRVFLFPLLGGNLRQRQRAQTRPRRSPPHGCRPRGNLRGVRLPAPARPLSSSPRTGGMGACPPHITGQLLTTCPQ